MAKQIPIQPPLKGLNEVDPLTAFDPNFATDVLNVRPYEQGSGRQAIGQRPGTGKWASLPVGADPVRVIKQISITAQSETTYWTDNFGSQADGNYTANNNQTQGEFDAGAVGMYGYDYAIVSNKATQAGSGRLNFYFKLTGDSLTFKFKWKTGTSTTIIKDDVDMWIGDVDLFGVSSQGHYVNIFHGVGGHSADIGVYVEFWKADGTETDSTQWLVGEGWADGDEFDVTIVRTNDGVVVTVGAHGTLTFTTPVGYGPYTNLSGNELAMLFRSAHMGTTGGNSPGLFSAMSMKTTVTTETSKLGLVDGGTFSTWSLTDGFHTPTGGAGGVNASGDVCIQPAFGKVYITDSHHFLVYDPIADTVVNAVATAGTLPTGYEFSCLFQGRLFLFRKKSDPGNWFASKLGAPLDFDTATGISTSAVVGNNSNAGVMAEAITAAIPWADNWLVMASANELHVLRGSPKTGNRDLITNQVGIVGPRAWCQLPNGSIVFVSQHGLYTLAPGGQPQPISAGRIRTFFDSIDFSLTSIEVAWSLAEQCVYVAAKPNDLAQPVTMLVWNVRNDSFWVDQYPATQGPSAMGAILFNSDRLLLFGGRDGYLRSIKPFLFDDDGVAITSRVRFSPIVLGDGDSLGRVLKTRMNWSSGIPTSRFAATYKFFTGNQASQAAAATLADHTRDVLLNPYQSIDRQRVRGGALAIEITGRSKPNGDTSAWGFETGMLEVAPAGRIRSTTGPDADLRDYGVPEGQIGGFHL